jgi:acetylglutamate kinase
MRNPEDATSVIPTINAESFQALVADGTISGGMIPKIENAIQAVNAGVKEVVITKADAIGKNGGTTIK